MNILIGTLADFQFSTSAMVPSNFEGLVGYRTLRHEGQVQTAYGSFQKRLTMLN